MNTLMHAKITRRDFLKGTAATSVALWCLSNVPAPALASNDNTLTADPPAVLIDLTRCVGCDSCALACKEANGLPQGLEPPRQLDKDTYTYVGEFHVVNKNNEEVTRYVKRQCMHCLNASCVSACPAAAMHKSDLGPVVYEASLCLGCRYCEIGCPFGVPQFDWNNGLTPTINKCQMCITRQEQGQKPACVEACPTGALHFGKRSEMLREAHACIESNPQRYLNHIYGEFEVGGTSWLYLSDVPFSALGFPANLPMTAPMEETEKIMTKLPFVIGGMAAILTGSTIYTHRESESQIAEEEA